MAALVTLSSTTCAEAVSDADTSVTLASLAGITPGTRLYVGQELMAVSAYGVGTAVAVRRGLEGTATSAHPSSDPVVIGRAADFYGADPVGPPPAQLLVSPWINVVTGAQWTAQGDETGPGLASRYWARTEHTRGVGALGVRTDVAAPSTVTVI